MSAMRAWGSIFGGSLVVAGAVLPWLTLDAGLQRYGGTTGVYGWLIVAAGALAIGAGVRELLVPAAWIARANGILGLFLAAFAVWLLIGVDELVHRPGTEMFVPRAGPGLFVVFAGAVTLAISARLPRFARLNPKQ